MAIDISILGLGESGVGAALLAQKLGYTMWLSDAGKVKQDYSDELTIYDLPFEEGSHSEARILSSDLIVKSPGIPNSAPVVQHALAKGIPVISEIEFASRHTTAKLIAITGSNGKTTTTGLTHHILKKAGYNVGLAGNIGHSFARLVADKEHDWYVLEVSSFQLDNIDGFKPWISMVLNITPDHLDRYGYNFGAYAASKLRIRENQDSNDFFIYCPDDAGTMQHITLAKGTPRAVPFSLQQTLAEGAFVQDASIHIHTHTQKNRFVMPIQDLALQGKHNVYNSMAAGIAACIVDIRKEVLRESLTDFKNEPHRLEVVAKVSGVEFINDSKATNVNSTWYALESMEHPVVWIVGGVDKGNDYAALQDLVRKRVKAIVCLGIENMRIHQAFSPLVDMIVNTGSMKEAVRMAHHLAEKDDIVLLSPACASFDLFDNYEDRGNQFKLAVRDL